MLHHILRVFLESGNSCLGKRIEWLRNKGGRRHLDFCIMFVYYVFTRMNKFSWWPDFLTTTTTTTTTTTIYIYTYMSIF